MKLPFKQYLLCLRQLSRHFRLYIVFKEPKKKKNIPAEADGFSESLTEPKAQGRRAMNGSGRSGYRSTLPAKDALYNLPLCARNIRTKPTGGRHRLSLEDTREKLTPTPSDQAIRLQ